jgi:integrase
MSIIKRKGPKGVRWAVKIKVKGKQHWVGTYDSQAQARKVEHEAIVKAAGPVASDATCDAFPQQWLALKPRPRASTNAYNRSALKKFSEDFHGEGLSDVTPLMALAWAQTPQNKWRVPTVRAMYNDAIKLKCCEDNPFASLGLPKSRGRRDIVPLTADEVQRLADCAVEVWGDGVGKELKAMILFAAYTGLRRGECSALEWSDIDFAAKAVTVSKTVSNDSEILLPKNGKPRTIALAPIAEQALREMHRHLHRDRVFAPPTGQFYTKSSWHYYWNPIRVKFGKPKYAFHELRHYCTTWLVFVVRLQARQAARQLGHADATLVENLYSHEDENEALSEIKAAFRHPPKKDDVKSLHEHREQRGQSDEAGAS